MVINTKMLKKYWSLVFIFLFILFFSIFVLIQPKKSKVVTPVAQILKNILINKTNTTTNNIHFHTYPWHTRILATTFWVGEIFEPKVSDGSQVCSTYDIDWAYHYSGVFTNIISSTAIACATSHAGGCDGVIVEVNSKTSCETELRTVSRDNFPTQMHPKENPFYVALPYDDVNDEIGFSKRCLYIPWSNEKKYTGHCVDSNFSYMKNRWIEVSLKKGVSCYGQIEDAGPSHDDLYHDAEYVFGTHDVHPVQKYFNNSGLDVSPALNGCLGFKELNGEGEYVSWRFVNDADVPAGPWKKIITQSQISQ